MWGCACTLELTRFMWTVFTVSNDTHIQESPDVKQNPSQKLKKTNYSYTHCIDYICTQW